MSTNQQDLIPVEHPVEPHRSRDVLRPTRSQPAATAAGVESPATVAEWRARFPRLVSWSPELFDTVGPDLDPAATLAPAVWAVILNDLLAGVFTLTSVDAADLPRAGLAVLDAVEGYADRLPARPLTNWSVWVALCAPAVNSPPVRATPSGTADAATPPVASVSPRAGSRPAVPPTTDAESGGYELRRPVLRRLTQGLDSGRGRRYFRTLPSPLRLVGTFGRKKPAGSCVEANFARQTKERIWNRLVADLVDVADGLVVARWRLQVVADSGHSPDAADVLRDYQLVLALHALDNLPVAFWNTLGKYEPENLVRIVGHRLPGFAWPEKRATAEILIETGLLSEDWLLPAPDLEKHPTHADWREQTRQVLLGVRPA